MGHSVRIGLPQSAKDMQASSVCQVVRQGILPLLLLLTAKEGCGGGGGDAQNAVVVVSVTT
jgi:hypothetical protein